MRRSYFLIPFAALTLVHLAALLLGIEALSAGTKNWLMPTLLLVFLTNLPKPLSLAGLLGSIALICSTIGDASDLGGEGFLVGLGAFAVAHIAYLLLFGLGLGLRLRSIRPYSIAYLLLCTAVLSFVLPHAGAMAPAVIFYSLVIMAMASWASAGSRWLRVGATLFVLSDSVLAMKLFIPGFEFAQIEFVIMATYTIGQALMIWGTVLARSARRAPITQPA